LKKGIGKELAKFVGINVKQSLYSDWGNFYAPIREFPCALFDKKGFIVINDETELEKFDIRVGKRVNARKGISSLPNYKEMKDFIFLSEDETLDQVFVEGAMSRIQINRYERILEARRVCIKHYGYSCYACGLKLEDMYGEIAKDFIHVHHIKPISLAKTKYVLDPIKDLRPVCPNCHSIIHRKKSPLDIETLKQFFRDKNRKTNSYGG
jgi:predicted HNH restriction endonuclease